MNAAARGKHPWAVPLAILGLAVLIRGCYLIYINLDADMAVTGLMGRHILRGHFPVFFYGQPFCGSIEAYLAAAIFALLGSSPLPLSLAPTLVGLIFVVVAYLAAKDMWGRQAGLWAMLFAACPRPITSPCTTCCPGQPISRYRCSRCSCCGWPSAWPIAALPGGYTCSTV